MNAKSWGTLRNGNTFPLILLYNLVESKLWILTEPAKQGSTSEALGFSLKGIPYKWRLCASVQKETESVVIPFKHCPVRISSRVPQMCVSACTLCLTLYLTPFLLISQLRSRGSPTCQCYQLVCSLPLPIKHLCQRMGRYKCTPERDLFNNISQLVLQKIK